MPNPIFDSTWFRRDLPVACEFERLLARTLYDPSDARRLAITAGLRPEVIDVTGPPSTFWGRILDSAPACGCLAVLITAIAHEPINPQLAESIAALDAATTNGPRRANRLMLDGNRPFLDRTRLRDLLPELQDWQSGAAVLVVRGARYTGRTATQVLLADGNDDPRVLLDESRPLLSSIRAIWKETGSPSQPPALGAEPLTTESAELADFWTDVKLALERAGRRLWVLFDDLDKGPGRVEVRALAEALAIRLRDIAFQRRLRLVLLGYPDAELPRKVPATLIRNDTTEELDASHVQAFLDYCLTCAGKQFDPHALPARASELCQQAAARVSVAASREMSFHDALYDVLTAWHRSEIR